MYKFTLLLVVFVLIARLSKKPCSLVPLASASYSWGNRNDAYFLLNRGTMLYFYLAVGFMCFIACLNKIPCSLVPWPLNRVTMLYVYLAVGCVCAYRKT